MYLNPGEFRDNWLTPDARDHATTAQLDEAIRNAAGRVNSKLAAAGYNLPLTSVGDSITSCVGAVAAWFLETTLGLIPEGESNVEKRAKNALRWLDELVSGKARLVDSTDTPVPRPAAVTAAVLSEPPRGW